MDLLAPLGMLELARALVFSVFSLVLPGWLFLRLDRKIGLIERARANDDGPLFSGMLETFCASIFFSIVICILAFIALTFTIGLNFWTALIFLALIDALMGYIVWKEKL